MPLLDAKVPPGLHVPAALAASEKIRQEVLTRYGIDADDVGTDAAYLTLRGSRAGQSRQKMHEAKLLAEGGFKGSERTLVEQRYERAEQELLASMEKVGREVEDRVTGIDSSRARRPEPQSRERLRRRLRLRRTTREIRGSPANTGANETQVHAPRGSRTEGTDPSAAATMGKEATETRKPRAGPSVGPERGMNGLTR